MVKDKTQITLLSNFGSIRKMKGKFNMPIDTKNSLVISTDKTKLNLTFIHQHLSTSYWSPNIPLITVENAINHSLCFGVYLKLSTDEAREHQIGFARVISDYATFAYLADVFIAPEYRGNGYSKFLIKTIINYPALQNLRRFLLMTKDAHGLYAQFGFKEMNDPSRAMEIFDPSIYK